MASSLPTDKLDKSNYASWSYKMHQYLLGDCLWSYVDGANDVAHDATYRGSFGLETSDKRGNVLLRVQCLRQAAQPYPRCRDAKESLDEPENGFRRKPHSSEAAAQAGVEQCTAERHVNG